MWQNQGHTHFSNSVSESSAGQIPGIDTSKAEIKLSVMPPDQNYAHPPNQKHFHKNKVSLPETGSRIQGASNSEKSIPEAVPPPPQHGLLPVTPQDPKSAAPQAEALNASPDAKSSGRPTEPIRPQSMGNIKIAAAVACRGIANRDPQETGGSFNWTSNRVYIWSLVETESHPSSIRHIYFFNGQRVSDIELEIRSSLWRTWSYKTLSDKRYIGHWRVDITSAEGHLLQRIKFQVK
jgi:hypothetical protein